MNKTWTPYQNLFFLAMWRAYKKHPQSSGKVILKTARELAEQMARFAYGDDVIDEDIDEFGYLWPSVKDGRVDLCKSVRFSQDLRNFLIRGRRRGRKVLDRTILCYTVSGFNAKEIVEQAFKDYQSAIDVPDLSEKDVATYHSFFWNFGSLYDLSLGKSWIARHLMDTDEERIINEEISAKAFRAKAGVTGNFDFEQRMKSLAQQSMHAIERCIAEVNVVDRSQLLMGGQNQGRYSNANMRNTAAMIGSLVPILKHYHDDVVGGQGDGSVEPLGEYMEERLESVLQESEQYDEHFGGWQDMHRGNTVSELMEENEEEPDEKDISDLL